MGLSAATLARMRAAQDALNQDAYDIWRKPEAVAGKVGAHTLYRAGDLFTIYPAPSNGRVSRAFEPLAGGRTTHFASTAYGADIQTGDQLRNGTRILAVEGVATDWDTALLLGLSEVAG